MRQLISVIALLLFSQSALGQDGSARMRDLEEKRKALMESIEMTGTQLEATQQTGMQLLEALSQITGQVAARKKFIDVINGEIKQIEKTERQLASQIKELERDHKEKQDAYANAIRKMYSKSSHVEKLTFLLASDNLSQAYRRFRYLREYTAWRRMQADDIVLKKKEIEERRMALANTRAEKQQVFEARLKERDKLVVEENKQKDLVQKIKKQERSLQAELKKKRQQAQALDKQIEAYIREEAEARKKEMNKAKAAKQRGKRQDAAEQEKSRSIIEAKPQEKGGYAMTKAEFRLSGNFAKNKGLLPVPIADRKYMLVGRFGQQKHEQLKYVTTQNSGIDLQTTPGAEARSVFDGVVSKVFAIHGSNKSVIIRHGNYLTVYSNLSEIYVKVGDRVSTKQLLGKIYADPVLGNRTVLNFQLWKETTKQNPQTWLNL